MAEAILHALSKIGSVGLNNEVSAVRKKLSKKVASLYELPVKIEEFGVQLKAMNNVMRDFGTTHLTNNVIKGWIADVRKLAYHVEDVIDRYSYEALKLKEDGFLRWYDIRSSRHITVFSIILEDVIQIEEEIRCVIETRKLILEDVIQIEEEIRCVIEMRNYGSITVQSSENEDADIGRKKPEGSFPELVSDEDLVGIDENRSKLTEWLTTNEEETTLITVSGMGGLGKTSLVKTVYDREKDNFPDAHAWIVVSEIYNVVDLLAKLLTKIQRQSPPSVDVALGHHADVYELTEAIQKTLQDRKCLIVLDDVWEREAYTRMCNAFQGLQGSRVMITTRREDVAALAPRGRRLLLQPLGSVESFKLFCSIAFHNNSPACKCPPELEKVAAAVVRGCHGLPLAIVYSGRVLSAKEQTEHTWNQIYNHLWSELQGNDHVQAILNRSYHDLPGYLRNCFLYCTLLPQGQPMPRESLVRLWIAEGFTRKREDCTAEEVAEECLMELIDRNMLQVVERDEHFRVSTCKMHDIVRDLALAVAKEQRFGSANDQGELMLLDTDQVRWFSTCGWSDSNNTAPGGVKFTRLRTLVSIGSCSNMLSSVFSESIYLTVLELEDSPINQVPASIGNLFHLRYIGLRRTQVRSLPDTIDKLSNLETLDLKHTRIEKLPSGIVKAEKLRHLFADRYADEKQTEFRYSVGVEAPKMISRFQQLQTLETVHASKDVALQLKHMHGLQTVCIDSIDASSCDDLFRALSCMPQLSSLLLSASDEEEALSFKAFEPTSTSLRTLIVRGGWFMAGLSCPIFQELGRYLKYLALSWCDLEEKDPLPVLACHVPALTYLSLNRVSSEGILVLSAGCFPLLKTLVLKRMPDVKQLVIEEGAMPLVDGIYITTLLGMNAVPDGIDTLGSLTKLWMLDLHREFKADWTQKQMDDKMKHVSDLRV
ncbi:disease resistance protein RPM1-like [Aegilops tauschii subsp. strangulata]|uniref:Disease resistance protein RPM1 n=3 Tax=Aegilops tauschii TaxID=37682 RepID=A0A453A607_AEGTS|nr:disease resistance protein RPM1-like [Aegilops tauschii subsp. strangulata]